VAEPDTRLSRLPASLPLSVTVGRRLPCSLLEGRRGARERETRAEEASGAETESRARRADAEVGSTTLVRSAGWRDARGPSQRLTDDRQTLLFFLARGTPSFREAECACKPVNEGWPTKTVCNSSRFISRLQLGWSTSWPFLNSI